MNAATAYVMHVIRIDQAHARKGENQTMIRVVIMIILKSKQDQITLIRFIYKIVKFGVNLRRHIAHIAISCLQVTIIWQHVRFVFMLIIGVI